MPRKATKHKPSPDTCLSPGCTKPRRIAGLCRACYAAASREMRQGRVTRPQLEALDLILPDARKGPRCPFAKALQSAH